MDTDPKAYNLDIKIGQMLMFGFKGLSSDDSSIKKLYDQIKQYHLGSLLFVGHNIKDPVQLKLLTKFFKTAESGIPLFMAIDQEGGLVQRINSKKGFEDYPSAEEVGNSFSPDQAKELYNKMLYTCRNYGMNYILAPVADLKINPESPVIGAVHRCYSDKPEIVNRFTEIFIQCAKEQKVISCLKHFPGHGSSTEDSHKDFTDITKTWNSKELDPYKYLIEKDCIQSVMSGHLFNQSVDPDLPASLSEKHLNKLLRNDLNYSGLIITDDLQMGAVHKHYDLENMIIYAINAGNDILMFSQFFNYEEDLPVKIIEIIKNALKSKKIKESRIDEAFSRIIDLKNSLL
jgi:beta-N-acetylhexosaminidase